MKINLMYNETVWGYHARLIVNKDGTYLSETMGSMSIRMLKSIGYQFKDILI